MARVRRLTYAEVLHKEQLTPSMVRVVLSAPGGGALPVEYPGYTDTYIKLVLPRPESGLVSPFHPDEAKENLDPALWPVMRTYTVRHWDAGRGHMTVDVVVHGDKGIAGPWSVQVQPGDHVQFFGPGGDYRPDPHADWHLLVGDESALPAIAAATEALPTRARGYVVIEVANAAEEQRLTVPDGVQVRWIHRDTSARAPGIELCEVVRSLDFPAGRVHAFVHGDATFVREIRSYLRFERHVPKEDLSASGYWRRGLDDEAWRAAKAEWKAAVEADEAAHAGVGVA